MKARAAESGTFWVVDARSDLPPPCSARVQTEFEEIGTRNVERLVEVAGSESAESIHSRLASGRRCFALSVDGEAAAYGWVTKGPERVGELEREFNLQLDEAYVWDCVTRPEWRGHRLYSALLSEIVRALSDEGVSHIWIGASRHNRPSVKGIENAGFRHVLDLAYRRLFRLTAVWFSDSRSAPKDLVAAGRKIILQDYERPFGRLAVGWFPRR